jgi:hypothetical protein
VQEIEDPELASKRTKAIYRAKGYSDAWIEKRMRGIAVREELTDEWKKRGIKEEPVELVKSLRLKPMKRWSVRKTTLPNRKAGNV